MRVPGWAKRTGPLGWSFGVFHQGPQPLPDHSELAEVLRQVAELVKSKEETGAIAGREFRVSRNSQGERTVRVETPWMTVQISERKNSDDLKMSVELPFGQQVAQEVF